MLPGARCSICSRPAVCREVDRLLAAGESNRGIAEELGLSPSTVQRHRTHVRGGLVDVPSAAGVLLRRGLRLLDAAEKAGEIGPASRVLEGCAGLAAVLERYDNDRDT